MEAEDGSKSEKACKAISTRAFPTRTFPAGPCSHIQRHIAAHHTQGCTRRPKLCVISGRHRDPELNHLPDTKIPQRANSKIPQRVFESPAVPSKFR
jgi:hypothetical protein